MSEKPYHELEKVGACLVRDGLQREAEGLLKAHEGIFNGTELYMTWRWKLSEILKHPSISLQTREEAIRVHAIIDKALH